MQAGKIVKITAVMATAIWLTGCASSGGKSSSGVASTSTAPTAPLTTDEVVVHTTPVLDPAVQAVVDSGKITGETPAQIEQLLNHTQYHFGFDSSKLTDRDYKALDVQAAYLNSEGAMDKRVVIQGHTDERGTRTYNLALGERRANAVKNYLVAKGVDTSRIEVISFGFEKPLDVAHNAAAWAKNRRAVILVN
ncbi:OmpA family protein [Candidatus Sororendozoicomonas aggregata]|uniref:OmpA family protein n=1 Tax=Candidatus Sororendozoicomonas aggregata TaxID=3073239 RepID=UPI002ED444DF